MQHSPSSKVLFVSICSLTKSGGGSRARYRPAVERYEGSFFLGLGIGQGRLRCRTVHRADHRPDGRRRLPQAGRLGGSVGIRRAGSALLSRHGRGRLCADPLRTGIAGPAAGDDLAAAIPNHRRVAGMAGGGLGPARFRSRSQMASRFLRWSPGILAGDDPGVALDPRDALQQPFHRRRQCHPPRAGLAVPEQQLARRAVDVVPPERDDLVLAAARQQQQANRRDRRREHRPVGFRLVQHPGQLPVLVRREEPLAAILFESAGLRLGGVMPQAAASLNIFASTSRVWFAWYGLSRIL